jgi:hypothetical protein
MGGQPWPKLELQAMGELAREGKEGEGVRLGAAWGAARGRHGEMLRALLPIRGYSATHSVRSVREEENNRKEDGERRRKRQGRKRKEKKRKRKKEKIWKKIQT